MAILKSKPLLLRACEAGEFGNNHPYTAGAITEALFTYLSGAVNEELFMQLCGPKYGRHLVCLSTEWEKYIEENCPDAKVYWRYEMKPAAVFKYPGVKELPVGFELKDFGQKEFDLRPFSHGENYRDFNDFKTNGSGAVIWKDDTIVSSASSFISLQN